MPVARAIGIGRRTPRTAPERNRQNGIKDIRLGRRCTHGSIES